MLTDFKFTNTIADPTYCLKKLKNLIVLKIQNGFLPGIIDFSEITRNLEKLSIQRNIQRIQIGS